MWNGSSVSMVSKLRPHIPFELPQHNFVRGEIYNREAMLLDRLYLLVHVEMRRWERAGATERRGPAVWAGAYWPRKDRIDRISPEIELSAAKHTANRNGMQITTDHQRHATFHICHRLDQAVVLLKPARLPVG